MFLSLKFDQIVNYLHQWQLLFVRWYYPLRVDDANYWRTYDNTTGEQKTSNLAGVLYDITWYLAHIMDNDSSPNMSATNQAVADMQDKFDEYEQSEQAVVDSISESFDSFNPDISDISSLQAVGWCSSYLQQVWESLGTYGTIILVGLFIGVCMQFLGFFKYR